MGACLCCVVKREQSQYKKKSPLFDPNAPGDTDGDRQRLTGSAEPSFAVGRSSLSAGSPGERGTDFDEPAKAADTLSHLSKDRPRASGRRPPSNKFRKTLAANSEDIFQDSSAGAAALGAVREEDDDLFGGAAAAATTVAAFPKAASAAPWEPVVAKAVQPSAPAAKSGLDSLLKDDTDIFSDVPPPQPKESSSSKKSKSSKNKNKSGDKLFSQSADVDDIFAGTTPVSSSGKSSGKSSSKSKKKESKVKAVDTASIFDDKAPSIFDDPLNAMKK